MGYPVYSAGKGADLGNRAATSHAGYRVRSGGRYPVLKDGKASLLDLRRGTGHTPPREAHKPCVRSGEAGKVKKAVFKIAL
ncbi:MAG: hypothetical protein ACLS5C_10060 [Waltera sp.]